MSITAEQRAGIPAEDFAGPDRSFPIRDQHDLDDAARLIGHAANPEAVRRAAVRIAKRKGLTIPDSWKDVGFGDDEMVERKARIFRFGHYPAKGWGITREEFVAANGETGTIPIGFDPKGLGHFENEFNALDGETGTATFSVVGDEVHTTNRMPSWLDRVREKLGLKISSVIGRSDGVLRKIDLVDRPHIRDAVFFADDDAVVLFDDVESVEFCDASAIDAWQQVHEIASHHHESLCSPHVKFARGSGPDRHVRMIHDMAVRNRAYCPGSSHHGDVLMADEEVQEVEVVETEGDVAFSEADMSPRERAMWRRLQSLEARDVDREAVAFADGVIRGERPRATPAQRQGLIEGYKRCAADDARLGDAVTFTDGEAEATGSRVDAFKAEVRSRPVISAKSSPGVTFTRLEEEPASQEAKEAEDRRKKQSERTKAWAKARNPEPASK